MPLLRQQPFVKKEIPDDLDPDEEIFFCKLTNEIFRDYDEFFERVILCNSLVWTCEITGRPNLTYEEAVESERNARKRLGSFPNYLKKPILLLALLTLRKRFKEMCNDVFVFSRDRFFVGERIEINDIKSSAEVIRVLGPEEQSVSSSISPKVVRQETVSGERDEDSKAEESDEEEKPSVVKERPKFPEPQQYQYLVRVMETKKEMIVDHNKISRKKGLYTRYKSKIFLKQHCCLHSGYWRLRKETIIKYSLDELNFSDFFPFVPAFPKSSPSQRGTSTGNKRLSEDEDDSESTDSKVKKSKEKKKTSLKLTAEEIEDLKRKLVEQKEEKKKQLERRKRKRRWRGEEEEEKEEEEERG